jgi:GTPase SAR1 family protein
VPAIVVHGEAGVGKTALLNEAVGSAPDLRAPPAGSSAPRRFNRVMPAARHCRHCLGDCPGDCLFGDSGLCIHGWNTKRPRQFSWQMLLTRKWWHRVFWGKG